MPGFQLRPGQISKASMMPLKTRCPRIMPLALNGSRHRRAPISVPPNGVLVYRCVTTDARTRSDENPRCLTLPFEESNRLLIERYESLPAKPSPLEGNDAVGEVPARIEHGQASIDRGAINSDIPPFNSACRKAASMSLAPRAVDPAQHPENSTAGRETAMISALLQHPGGGRGSASCRRASRPDQDIWIRPDPHSCRPNRRPTPR